MDIVSVYNTAVLAKQGVRCVFSLGKLRIPLRTALCGSDHWSSV